PTKQFVDDVTLSQRQMMILICHNTILLSVRLQRLTKVWNFANCVFLTDDISSLGRFEINAIERWRYMGEY
ncbi:MAG: hypothetical protein WC387_03420, partial [Candidatus Paceibacterota bacterium]